jgi:ribonuclease HII
MSKLKSYHTEGIVEAGIDEVGRGCLAGPVVAAAVILPNNFDYDIVKDSKKLSEKRRKEAYELIKEHAIDYSISFVPASSIDEINIGKATMAAMNKCVEKLEKKPEHLLIDGNVFENAHGIPHTCVVKGDNTYYSIAAASILAKVTRDEYMVQKSKDFPFYKWESNKGYGAKVHRDAIKEHGITQYHRKTFLKNILQ